MRDRLLRQQLHSRNYSQPSGPSPSRLTAQLPKSYQACHFDSSTDRETWVPQGAYDCILFDILPWTNRPLTPTTMQKDVFNRIHNLSHTGVWAMGKFLKERFVFKSSSFKSNALVKLKSSERASKRKLVDINESLSLGQQLQLIASQADTLTL